MYKAIQANLEAKREFAVHYQAIYPARNQHADDSTVVATPEDYCRQYGLHLRTVQRWGSKYVDIDTILPPVYIRTGMYVHSGLSESRCGRFWGISRG